MVVFILWMESMQSVVIVVRLQCVVLLNYGNSSFLHNTTLHKSITVQQEYLVGVTFGEYGKSLAICQTKTIEISSCMIFSPKYLSIHFYCSTVWHTLIYVLRMYIQCSYKEDTKIFWQGCTFAKNRIKVCRYTVLWRSKSFANSQL